jgi:hypothetical protein
MSSILRCGGIGKSVNPQLPIPEPAGSPYFSVFAAIWMGSEVQGLTMMYGEIGEVPAAGAGVRQLSVEYFARQDHVFLGLRPSAFGLI